MRRFLAFLFIYAVVIFGLHLMFGDWPWMTRNVQAAGTTYYISISGSNSNSGTLASPWKSAPGMQTAAGCGGTTHSYSPNPGDQFVFKGGDTWPAACFPVVPLGPGNSSVSDYWGACGGQSSAPSACAGATWPSTGWTRPIFDAQQTTISHYFTFDNEDYQIVDDIDMRNQNLTFTFGASSAIQATPGGSIAVVHILVENVYIHDFMTTGTLSNANGSPWYSAGGIRGYVVLKNSTIDDSGGFGFNASSTMVTGGMIGGGCENCQEVSGSRFIDTVAACFGVTLCHDTEITGQDQNVIYGSLPNFYNMNNTVGNHSQGVEAENGEPNFTVYNNWIHNNPDPGIQVFVGYCGSQVYNNVFSNNGNNYSIQMTTVTAARDSSSCRGYVYNNTIDCSLNNACVQAYYYNNGGSPSFILGQIIIENNQLINGSGSGTIGNTLTSGTVTQTTNTAMTSQNATNQGYTSQGKYAPTSGTGATVNAGTNLTSSCSANLAQLCTDASGAPWFGGSGKPRPTGSALWDTGAYEFTGGSTGPPTISISSPSPGSVSGSLNLTATCTPVSPATCASVQYTIDGFSFGAAQTTSPYTLSWNTATAANANHVIGATATDSNGRTAPASTVTVTVNNSIPGCFVSTDYDSGALSWTANQSFTPQSANFTSTVVVTPNTNDQDSVIALSQAAMTAYAQGAVLLRFNSSGDIDAWNDAVGGYTWVGAPSSPITYTAGTAYAFTLTVNFSGPNAGTYSLSETSPSSITIATNYAFRSTASFASLGFVNAISDNTTPDTAKVCNFQVGSSTTLTFSPSSLAFPNTSIGSSNTLSIGVTSAGGSTSFTSVVSSDTTDFPITNGCTGSQTSCPVSVKFQPAAAQAYTATVTFTDSATGSPQVVNLSGLGIAAASSATPSPTSINFGNVQLGLGHPVTSGIVTVALANGPVVFTSVTFSNADFGAASNSCTGSVSAPSCQITPQFTPSSLSTETATMTITDNAPTGGSTQTVSLIGTGVNNPVPAPATQFVLALPIQHTVPVVINGIAIGILADNFTCNLICIPKSGATPPWSCSCQ